MEEFFSPAAPGEGRRMVLHHFRHASPRWPLGAGSGVKKHIASATRVDVLHVDTFNTIVVEAEGILNRRPLTPISSDPLDTEALTPAMILYPSTFSHSAATIVPDVPGDGLHHVEEGAE